MGSLRLNMQEKDRKICLIFTYGQEIFTDFFALCSGLYIGVSNIETPLLDWTWSQQFSELFSKFEQLDLAKKGEMAVFSPLQNIWTPLCAPCCSNFFMIFFTLCSGLYIGVSKTETPLLDLAWQGSGPNSFLNYFLSLNSSTWQRKVRWPSLVLFKTSGRRYVHRAVPI